MPIYWDSNFEVGNDIIDQQHMRLVSIYNILEETFYEHKNFQTVELVFENFRDYIQFHLNMEEIVKNENNIIEIENHLISHQILLKKIQKCYSLNFTREEGSFREILFYFNHCLIEHLEHEKNTNYFSVKDKFSAMIKNTRPI